MPRVVGLDDPTLVMRGEPGAGPFDVDTSDGPVGHSELHGPLPALTEDQGADEGDDERHQPHDGQPEQGLDDKTDDRCGGEQDQ
jgi:hypothetical protein